MAEKKEKDTGKEGKVKKEKGGGRTLEERR